MTFVNKVFSTYDICSLIIPFCSFKTIVSLCLCNNDWKEHLYDERSVTVFKKYIIQKFNFSDEKELIESGKEKFFIRYASPYKINNSLSDKIYNEAINMKKGYDIFLNFYCKLDKIINKIDSVYDK